MALLSTKPTITNEQLDSPTTTVPAATAAPAAAATTKHSPIPATRVYLPTKKRTTQTAITIQLRDKKQIPKLETLRKQTDIT